MGKKENKVKYDMCSALENGKKRRKKEMKENHSEIMIKNTFVDEQ